MACRTAERRTDLNIDWAAIGHDERTFDELVEFLLRIIQSMTITPPIPPRPGRELRAYLYRWIGPRSVTPRTLCGVSRFP